MNKLLIAAASATLAVNASAATVFFEGFETDGNGTRYSTNQAEFSDGAGDFFTRTDGSNIGGFVSVTGQEGNYWFHAMDLDGEGAVLPLTLSFAGIDISDYSNLAFSTLVAEDDDGANQDWDLSDNVLIEYQIDAGGYQNLMAFESIPIPGISFNGEPAQDVSFDGNGDVGLEITDAFSLFSAGIAGTGSTLDLRFTFDLNSGDEDIAFDAITVTGDVAAVPVPAAAWLFGSALCGLTIVRRKNK